MPKKLLTIVAENALEDQLMELIKEWKVNWFTITNCRMCDAKGLRAGDWDQNRTVSFQIICDEDVAVGIMELVKEAYSSDYAVNIVISSAHI